MQSWFLKSVVTCLLDFPKQSERSSCCWDACLQKQRLSVCYLDILCPSANFPAALGLTLKPRVAAGIQKFCKSDQCLNIVFKVKIKAVGSNACCVAAQAGKMLSAEEIFGACSDANYRAALPGCAVPVAGATDPGRKKSGDVTREKLQKEVRGQEVWGKQNLTNEKKILIHLKYLMRYFSST